MSETVKNPLTGETRPIIKGPHDVGIVRFSSPVDFARFACDFSEKHKRIGKWETGKKDMTADELRALAIGGDLSNVAAAETLLQKFATEIERGRAVWELSPVGAFPAVPEFLTGEPCSMWQQSHGSDDRAPVRIVANTTISAGLDHETILKRGVAVLALVLKLSEIRPVSLTLINAVDNGGKGAHIIALDIPTAPLDLAHAAFAMSHVAWTRALGYAVFDSMKWDGGWPWRLHPFDGASRATAEQRVREAMALEETDVYLHPAHLDSPEVRDPVKFINDTLAKYIDE